MKKIPPILAAAGLAHDLGNPPFGHQGEHAIRSWFKNNPSVLGNLDEKLKTDFTVFEGNAQMLRLLTRLQLKTDNYGLDLTVATLASLIKYPTSSWECKQAAEVRGEDVASYTLATKKPGYFASEAEIVREVWERTGLSQGIRHPLAYLMEACDDIAYSVCDIEDAVKKQLVSFSDIVDALEAKTGDEEGGDDLIARILKKSKADYRRYRNDRKLDLTPAELNVLSTEKFRVYAIAEMVIASSDAFKASLKLWEDEESLAGDLLENSPAKLLRGSLKEFAVAHAYSHRAVLEVEQLGYRTIHRLMDILWDAIGPEKRNPPQKFVYGAISENYRRALLRGSDLPATYLKLRLLTDMISGMTDRFAISLLDQLAPIAEGV